MERRGRRKKEELVYEMIGREEGKIERKARGTDMAVRGTRVKKESDERGRQGKARRLWICYLEMVYVNFYHLVLHFC